jgi:molybdopterin synthase catalytic subunit
MPILPPVAGDDWLGVCEAELPVAAAGDWAVLPSCGAVVSFSGTSRNHSEAPDGGEHRAGVTVLDYEAYDGHVLPRLAEIAAELRRRWPAVGRVVLLHRLGAVSVGSSSVVVVVSAPHRREAFAAAQFGIDAIKATVPIWKRETWPGGSSYGLDAHPVDDIRTFSATATTASPTSPLPAARAASPTSPLPAARASDSSVGACRT